jgi:uncharacterized protein (TIGR00661 family)
MGDGHFSRACAIVPRLRAAGLDVDVVFSGDHSSGLKVAAEKVRPYRAFYGLTYVRHEGRVNYSRTISRFRPGRLRRDYRSLGGRYDLVITDFEPLTAWWGRNRNIPVIGISHHYALWGPAPRPRRPDPLAEAIIRWYAPVDVPIGLHWRPTTPTTLPPVIRPEVAGAAPHRAGHVLFYLPSYTAPTIDALCRDERLRGYRFIAYPRKDDYEPRASNLTLKPFSRQGFAADLAAADAVVTNAGFTLLSECFHLGKPVYSVPEAGQREQQINAAALRKWDLAICSPTLRAGELAGWLRNPPPGRPTPFPNVVDAFVNWITGGMNGTPERLAERLWEQVDTGNGCGA